MNSKQESWNISKECTYYYNRPRVDKQLTEELCPREPEKLKRFSNKDNDYRKCGVYFLWDNGQLVYIGKSTNILSRADHHNSHKAMTFDQFSYCELPEDIFGYVEDILIGKHKPKYNSPRTWRGLMLEEDMIALKALKLREKKVSEMLEKPPKQLLINVNWLALNTAC